MKRISLTFVCLLLLCSLAYAQQDDAIPSDAPKESVIPLDRFIEYGQKLNPVINESEIPQVNVPQTLKEAMEAERINEETEKFAMLAEETERKNVENKNRLIKISSIAGSILGIIILVIIIKKLIKRNKKIERAKKRELNKKIKKKK